MTPLIVLALAAFVDVTAPGTYVEQLDIPQITPNARHCIGHPCVSLLYTVRYVERSCLAPVRATVLHADVIVPIKIDEIGDPGSRGYTWSLSTTRLFRGHAAVVIEIGDICHDKS